MLRVENVNLYHTHRHMVYLHLIFNDIVVFSWLGNHFLTLKLQIRILIAIVLPLFLFIFSLLLFFSHKKTTQEEQIETEGVEDEDNPYYPSLSLSIACL